MTWEIFYEKCGDWSESTQIKHISSLTDFGSSDEICDAVGYMSEKAATKLVRKAIAAGVVFSAENLEELDFYVEPKYMENLTQKHSCGMTWTIFYEHYYSWEKEELQKKALAQQHFGSAEEVTEVAYDLHDKGIATQFIRNAITAGIKFESDNVQELDGSIEQSLYEELLAMLGEGLTWELFYDSYDGWPESLLNKHIRSQRKFGSSEEVCEVANYLTDRAICTEFIRNAMRGGVQFTADEILDLDVLVDASVIVEIVEAQKIKLTHSQVEDLSYTIDKGAVSQIARMCDVKLDTDGHVIYPVTEEDIAFEQFIDNVQMVDDMLQQQEARRRAKPGFGIFLLAALAAFGKGSSKKNNRNRTKPHHGRCDGDCANCPPHYGYRYGRWYYGRHHHYGCQYGGNRGAGGLD